jgi:hypothetical protein
MERQTTPPDPPDPFDEFLRERRAGQGEAPPPPPGWETPPQGWERGSSPPQGVDLRALFVLLDGLRRVVPRELEGQLTNLIREFLLTLRSLIDWYLERLDRPEKEPRVEDIPID